jgi:carbon storage regulator
MLTLSRKEKERIVLSNGVTIEVKEIRGSIVRIGVEAPPDVKILREELVPGDLVFQRNADNR